MKKIFNENKTLFILAIIIIISLIFMGVGLIRYFYGSNKDPYGDRLRDKDKYPISENIGRDIKALYESGVSSVNVDVGAELFMLLLMLLMVQVNLMHKVMLLKHLKSLMRKL